MSEFDSICPKCGKMVSFVESSWFATCPECGFQYKLKSPSVGTNRSDPATTVAAVAKALAIVVLIMFVIAVVGVAVLFAGCAMVMITN